MPGFTTKRLAPWRLLARVSLLAWIAGAGECKGCASPGESRRCPDSRPGRASCWMCAGAGRARRRGGQPGGRRHPGSASWRGRSGAGGGARPGQAGDTDCHRPALGDPLPPCRAGSGGMEGPGGKGWACRGRGGIAGWRCHKLSSRGAGWRYRGKGERKCGLHFWGHPLGCRGSPSFWSPQTRTWVFSVARTRLWLMPS